MEDILGLEEAARVSASRDRAASAQAWQIRKGEILRSQIPVFFSAMGERIKTAAADFNGELGLDGDHGISVHLSERTITIRKTQGVVFLRTILHYFGTERVSVTTQTVRGYRQDVSTSEMLFDVSSDGVVTLNEKSFFDLAKDLFRGATDCYIER